MTTTCCYSAEWVGWLMTGRLFSRQACESPSQLFNTWLDISQVKWQCNSLVVNFLNRSRCWECDKEGLGFHWRMRGDCVSLMPDEGLVWVCVCVIFLSDFEIFPCIKGSLFCVNLRVLNHCGEARSHSSSSSSSCSSCLHPICLVNWSTGCVPAQVFNTVPICL